MLPRVFLSSTYYDLKHVRERLEKFIQGFGFEPVLFESDKVTYEYGKPAEHSAYVEVALCHVVVLIIGGRYGSLNTQTDQPIGDDQHEEYISITRKEVETAINKKIPILVLIDKNVYSDYQTYKENQPFFDAKDSRLITFKFTHTDDLRIFNFIDSVKSIAFKTFEKVEEIENYLRLQFAGMFYLYLESLKRKTEEKEVLDKVKELNNLGERMNEMLNSIGKKVLQNAGGEYMRVIENQFRIVLDFFGDKIQQDVKFNFEVVNTDLTSEQLKSIDFIALSELFYNVFLASPLEPLNLGEKFSIKEYFQKKTDRISGYLDQYNSQIRHAYPSLADLIEIKQIELESLNDTYQQKVKNLVSDKEFEQMLLEKIASVFAFKFDPLPF